jgi:hypothetical protein
MAALVAKLRKQPCTDYYDGVETTNGGQLRWSKGHCYLGEKKLESIQQTLAERAMMATPAPNPEKKSQ